MLAGLSRPASTSPSPASSAPRKRSIAGADGRRGGAAGSLIDQQTQEVRGGDDADRPAVAGDQQAVDVAVEHAAGHLGDGGVLRHPVDRGRYAVADPDLVLP